MESYAKYSISMEKLRLKRSSLRHPFLEGYVGPFLSIAERRRKNNAGKAWRPGRVFHVLGTTYGPGVLEHKAWENPDRV